MACTHTHTGTHSNRQTHIHRQAYRGAHRHALTRTTAQQTSNYVIPTGSSFLLQRDREKGRGRGRGRQRAEESRNMRVRERGAAAAESPSSIARHTEHFATLDRRRRSVRSFFFNFPFRASQHLLPYPTHALPPPSPSRLATSPFSCHTATPTTTSAPWPPKLRH